MIEERPTRLLEALEGRVGTLLGVLRESRVRQAAQRTRLDELERRRVELEAGNAELAAEAREEATRGQALERRLVELEARLAESEATRLELLEENRELDEQNRELEAHNKRLLERAAVGEPAPVFQRQGRRAQGLSALIGHRPRHTDDAGQGGESGTAPAAGASTPPPAVDGATVSPAPAGEAATASPRREASTGEAPSPQALLEQWYQRYGATFFKGHTRPLKVGIHEELAAGEPWPEKLVRRALACYVNLPRYLKSVREGAERIDLTGAPSGRVDAAAAEHAHKKLERLQADRRRSGQPAARRRKAGRTGGAPAHNAEPPRPDAPAPSAEVSRRPAPVQDDEPAEQRLQRKLDALMARHNGR